MMAAALRPCCISARSLTTAAAGGRHYRAVASTSTARTDRSVGLSWPETCRGYPVRGPTVVRRLSSRAGAASANHHHVAGSRRGIADGGSASRNVTTMEDSSRGSPFAPAALAFIEKVVALIREGALVAGTDRSKKLLEFHHPAQLQELFDLEVGELPAREEDLLDACQKVIQYSVKTSHPMFFNQLYKNSDPYSLMGSWITESLNTNGHTYEVSPVFNVMELSLSKKICSYLGYNDGEAMFLPGGNMGNMTGLHLGRYVHDKGLKHRGMYSNKPLVIFTSVESHYSIKTAGSFMGFGMDNVVAVDTDSRSRMCMEDLERKIQQVIDQGRTPFALVATSGTTVMGAYDPLNACADLCQKYNMWLHVDAAWGGGVLVSDNLRHLVNGIHRADSVLWNMHKMLGSQLQSSALAVKRKGLLQECNGLEATYLFHKDKHYDISYDFGDKSIQCGRKPEAFKIWLMWKALGSRGLQERVDRAFELARYMVSRLKVTEGFRLVSDEFECLNVCFWYIPLRLRGQSETSDWWAEIHKIGPVVKERMMTSGTMMIGYCPLESRGYVNFFRIIVNGSQLDEADIDYVIEMIDNMGKDL